MSTGIVDSFLIYQTIRRLTLPFNKWKAFQLGVIDADGNILIEPKDRTREQAKSLQLFDVMILNLKKLLAKIPGGSSRFATFTAALFLLKEEYDLDNLESFINQAADDREFLKLYEDIANVIGTGEGTVQLKDTPIRGNFLPNKLKGVKSWSSYAGTQVVDYEEYKNDKKKSKDIQEDIANNAGSGGVNLEPFKPTKNIEYHKFAGGTVFDVDSDVFMKARYGKPSRHRYSKYLGEDEVSNQIRQYCITNPQETIFLRERGSGAMIYFKKGKKK